jgi:predicted nuclease of predicted toxin-antitoxin system
VAIGRIRSSYLFEVKILIDMNLTPLWCEYLAAYAFESSHWSEIGPFNAPDPEIMSLAQRGGSYF